MPKGCPEQTFYSFIPNIAAMWYLNSTGELSGNDKEKTKNHIEFGYQEMLKLKGNRTDGSFTFWKEESVWLTAYLSKIMAHIRTLISIDPKIIECALNFLVSQESNGNFVEMGMPSYWAMPRNIHGAHGDALSAFVAIAFLEAKSTVASFTGFKRTVDNILNKVIGKLPEVKDHHIKAMYAYAFSLNNDKKEADDWLKDLIDNGKVSDNTIHWEINSKPLQVETAAYAVMAYVNIGKHLEAWPIVNWMMTQRSFVGGFYTTTDTVLGIQALSSYAKKVYSSSTDMRVLLKENKKVLKTFNLNTTNAFKVHVEKLPYAARNISFEVKGGSMKNNGFAYVQVTKSFNKAVESKDQFEVTAVPQPGGRDGVLDLKVCASFIAIEGKNASGMTLIEIQLPSGYVYDSYNTELLLKATEVKVR